MQLAGVCDTIMKIISVDITATLEREMRCTYNKCF